MFSQSTDLTIKLKMKNMFEKVADFASRLFLSDTTEKVMIDSLYVIGVYLAVILLKCVFLML